MQKRYQWTPSFSYVHHFYVTFEVECGDRMELHLTGLPVVGIKGKLASREHGTRDLRVDKGDTAMANEVCVFCGQKPGTFRSTTIACGNTVQVACKSCEKELKGLEEAEVCRRALIRGIAQHPERIRDRIELLTEAENHRPKCLRCGTNLTFMKVQALDNSPMQDSIFQDYFEVLPAYCKSCGKYEFYNPAIIRKNKYLAYLIWKDAQG